MAALTASPCSSPFLKLRNGGANTGCPSPDLLQKLPDVVAAQSALKESGISEKNRCAVFGMPSVGSGYTFTDFLHRLERSPVTHMSPLYHEHRLLFVNRPDMLSKAVLSVSWERGLALLQAAYYTQAIATETYRAMLARMLRHNRHVMNTGAGQLVGWQAAMNLMCEAVLTHGTTLPTRVSVSALRLLAPHRQWQTAIDVLKLNQTNGQLTKPMLLDAAHACATSSGWRQALQLLTHLHKQDPALLFDAIQSMRPPGTNALTSATTAHALLPDVHQNGAPTRVQQHILEVLNSVVGSVPSEVALSHPLCLSYLTYLLASTTLRPDTKVQRATEAMQQLPWTAVLTLLSDLSEPDLLTETEWSRVERSHLLPVAMTSTYTQTRGEANESVRVKAKKRRGTKRTNKRLAVEDKQSGTQAAASPLPSDEELPSSPSSASSSPSTALSTGAASLEVSEFSSSAVQSANTFFSRLPLLHVSPLTAAAMMAVMVEKLPTPEMAVSFLHECALHLVGSTGAATTVPSSKHGEEATRGADLAGSVAAARHPVVIHALLRNCIRHQHGWRTAASVLLERGSTGIATPTALLSSLVRQLRGAKQATLAVRLLHHHIIPSGSRLTPEAWEDMLECVLAHNRAIRLRAAAVERRAPNAGAKHSQNDLQRVSGVHWISALSWVVSHQSAPHEDRILTTGTGPSRGATARRPSQIVSTEATLSAKMLSLLINICVQGGSPQGALHALGYARRVNKMELPQTPRIRALLYCMQYDRPSEAEAIVEQCACKEMETAAEPLRHLLRLIRESKSTPSKEDDADLSLPSTASG